MRIHLPAVGPTLPIHPRTGLIALGLRRNGQPIWPVRGGSGDDDPADQTDDGDDSADGGQDDDGTDDLRDAGKKALDTMKGQRNHARANLRPWTALARELGVKTADEVKALINGKANDDAPDPEQIRREARAEAQRETLNDRVLDKIEAKARKFADPADAAALLLREHGVDDFLDGTRIDGDAIGEALDDLLERKPYLGTTPAKPEPRGPKPDPSQGSRGGTAMTGREQGLAEAQKRFGKPAATQNTR